MSSSLSWTWVFQDLQLLIPSLSTVWRSYCLSTSDAKVFIRILGLVGQWTVCRSGTHSSIWLFQVCSCCVRSGGLTRLEGCCQFPIGFSVAGNVRVGNAMGAGDVAQAKLSARLSMICAVSVAMVLATVVGSSKDVIAYIFTNDKDIRARVATVMVLYAPFHLLDATAAAGGSIVKGLGKQKIGAICNLVGYYGVGCPIGISLMFAAKMGIFGLWTGLVISVFLQSMFFIILLFKLNWEKCSEEAQIRAGVIPRRTDDGAQEDGGHTEDCDLNNATEMDGLVEEQTDVVIATVKVQLPLRVLVLRRGLALIAMLVLLVAGLVVKFFLNR
ncbi:multidrug and toxin extrusion protein 1 isoform X2 [Chanodichthys erythropterus]|uniref:multidrug and toxin extrusion protein 1 isoform X2 n=1 Tax=Chanodichthys erythropterus TaxID=933992 RepID=UPI00351E05D8